MAAAARERPASVIAELGIAAGWRMPLPRLAGAEREITDRHLRVDPAPAA